MALKKCIHKLSSLNRVILCEQYVCINQQSINALNNPCSRSFYFLYHLYNSVHVIFFNIFYIFSEITVTILIPHKHSIVQQLKLSNTNKCQLDKRKVTWLCFEPTHLTSPVKITLSNERLNRSAIIFVKRLYRKQLHCLLALQQSLGDVLKWSWFSKLLIIQIWLLA